MKIFIMKIFHLNKKLIMVAIANGSYIVVTYNHYSGWTYTHSLTWLINVL